MDHLPYVDVSLVSSVTLDTTGLNRIYLEPVLPDIRSELIARLDPDLLRGGLTVKVDGEWHDLRFWAVGYDGRDPATEAAALTTDNLRLLLRATEVR